MGTKTCTLEHRAIRAMLAGCFTKKQINKSRQANTNFTFGNIPYTNAKKKDFHKLENGKALIVEKRSIQKFDMKMLDELIDFNFSPTYTSTLSWKSKDIIISQNKKITLSFIFILVN